MPTACLPRNSQNFPLHVRPCACSRTPQTSVGAADSLEYAAVLKGTACAWTSCTCSPQVCMGKLHMLSLHLHGRAAHALPPSAWASCTCLTHIRMGELHMLFSKSCPHGLACPLVSLVCVHMCVCANVHVLCVHACVCARCVYTCKCVCVCVHVCVCTCVYVWVYVCVLAFDLCAHICAGVCLLLICVYSSFCLCKGSSCPLMAEGLSLLGCVRSLGVGVHVGVGVCAGVFMCVHVCRCMAMRDTMCVQGQALAFRSLRPFPSIQHMAHRPSLPPKDRRCQRGQALPAGSCAHVCFGVHGALRRWRVVCMMPCELRRITKRPASTVGPATPMMPPPLSVLWVPLLRPPSRWTPSFGSAHQHMCAMHTLRTLIWQIIACVPSMRWTSSFGPHVLGCHTFAEHPHSAHHRMRAMPRIPLHQPGPACVVNHACHAHRQTRHNHDFVVLPWQLRHRINSYGHRGNDE